MQLTGRWVAKSVQRPIPPMSKDEAPKASSIQFVRWGSRDGETVHSPNLFDVLSIDLTVQGLYILDTINDQMRIALAELFTNAARYGHPEDRNVRYVPDDFVFEYMIVKIQQQLYVVFTMTDCGPDLQDPIEEMVQRPLDDVALLHNRGLLLFIEYCKMTVKFRRLNELRKVVRLVGKYTLD